MKQFNTNSFVTNGCSSKSKTIHEQPSPKDKMVKKSKSSKFFRPWENEETEDNSCQSQVEPVRFTLQDQHLGTFGPAQKVVNLNDPPTDSNNLRSVRPTTTIPPSSMAAIQQSMFYANAIPMMPPSLTPLNSPFDERYGVYTMDRRWLYPQPAYVNIAGDVPAYSANYLPANPYTIPMMNMLHTQRQMHIPAQPGIAQPGFTHNVVNTLPYTALPTHSTAGRYYHTNVAQPWLNMAYTNYPIAMQQERATSAPPSPTRAQQAKGCAGMPKTRSFPDSTALNALVTQVNMDNKKFYPEVQVASTSPQYYNEPKNQAKVTENLRPQQAIQPTISTKVSSPAPTPTKPLLPETMPTPCNSTKRKPIEYLAGKLTASGKKIKMMSSAIKLVDKLKYRPNMVRHRSKKEETVEQQLVREQNTIACRKYRRIRRIAKILEQEMVESANHNVDIL